jgi:hypothetical protein
MRRNHHKNHKKTKRDQKKHLSFLEVVRLYGSMVVGV